MENGWRLNKIITEKKDTFYLSEKSELEHVNST